MKRLFAILLAVLLLLGVAAAEDEITFNSIPWLSDITTAIQTLTDAGLVQDGKGNPVSAEYFAYYVVDDTDFVAIDRIVGTDDVTFAIDLFGEVKGRIAGYPVKDLILTFAYDGEYKLIAIQVELIKGSYDDLKAKLTKVYGDAGTTETDEGIWSTAWKGDNNSAVVLYTQSEGNTFTLMYGRLDAAEILQSCLTPPASDDVSGL